MNAPRQAARELPPAAELLWDRLRAEFALQDGFWLGVLFGVGPVELAELIARSRDLAGRQVREVEVLRLDGTHSAAHVLSELARPRAKAATWVVDGSPSPDGDGGWDDRWVALLRRLNERRDVVRARHPGALLLACPRDLLPVVRDEAPDLWSFRTLTAGVDATTTEEAAPRPRRAPIEPGAGRFAVVAGEPARASNTVGELLRRSAGALRTDRPGDAVAAASDALAAAGGPDDRVLAHAWLAQARAAQEEPGEAARHAAIALDAGRPLEEATTVALLEILLDSLDPDVAMDAAAALVALRRELVARGEGPQTLRDLSVSLNNVAGIQAQRGDLDTAQAGYTESLDLRRRLLERYGETPQTLRDLTVSLQWIGHVQERRESLDAARAAHREAALVAEDLRRRYGPPFWTESLASYTRDALERLTDDTGPSDAGPG